MGLWLTSDLEMLNGEKLNDYYKKILYLTHQLKLTA